MKNIFIILSMFYLIMDVNVYIKTGILACRSGMEVAGCIMGMEIRVWFLAYTHCVWALWCLMARKLNVSGRPGSRDRFGT